MTTTTHTTTRHHWTEASHAWQHDLTAAGKHPNLTAARAGRDHLEAVATVATASPWTLDPAGLTTILERLGPDAPAATQTLHRFYRWAVATGRARRSPLDETSCGAWAHAVEDFASHLERADHPSPATRADYTRRVFTYGSTLPAGPFELDARTLEADLDARNWSTSTRRATLVALRRFYGWAIKASRIQRSPLVGMPDGAPKRPGPLNHSPSPAWAEPIADHLTNMRAAGRRPGTVNLRRFYLTHLSHTFADPWRVTTDDLALYLANPGWKPDSRRSARSAVRQFYRWAVLTDRLDRDPTVPLAPITVPRALPRPAPDEAVLHAFEHADARTRIAIECGMYAGLRISEVAALAWADVAPACLSPRQ